MSKVTEKFCILVKKNLEIQNLLYYNSAKSSKKVE
jgi:hypothetical protein